MPLSIPGTAAAVTAATSAMPPSYIICIVIIALEVIIITAMVIFLLWKPKEDQDPPQRPSNEVCVDYGQEDADQDVVIPADGGGSQPIVINYENEEDKHSKEMEGLEETQCLVMTERTDQVGSRKLNPQLWTSTLIVI